MAEVIVRPGAQADIRAAALWYESQREGLGSEFILHFDTLVERIEQNPLQFPEIGSGVRRALLQRFPLRDLLRCCNLPGCYCGFTSAPPP